ncbi:MAG: hypothetical protein LIO62_02085, partial [Clostridiales bacterium]|nr:hypothetical protein [Clostridiales bacterium]
IEETNVKDLLKRKSKLLITLAVVLAVFIVGIVLICVNSYAIEIEATYLMMPKTISADESDLDFDLHIRKNSDYDLETQSSYPLEAFEYYYTDPDTGEEVVIKGTDSAEIEGEEVSPYIVFLYKAYGHLRNL